MAMVASTTERMALRREFLIRVYRSANNREWYWNQTNRGNREIEASSSQGYKNKDDCTKNLWRVTGFEADVVVDEGTPG